MARSALSARLRAGGIVAPAMAVAEAKRAGLELPLACALLEKESSGGHNVFGHDPTIFVGAGAVTREKYLEYRRRRRASGNRLMQGVGPCQLTWWEFQDTADREGGCWRPDVNMRVGFRHLAALVARFGEADGARRYNGSGDAAVAYSRDLLAKARRWEQMLAGTAPAAAGGPRLLRRGDEGVMVERLTRRLSFIRSRETGRPFLDGARGRLDGEAEAALKAFQREQGLDDDGVFGPLTARRLKRAVEREKERRGAGETQPAGGDEPREPAVSGELAELVGDARRADRRSDRALEELVAHGRELRRRLGRERERAVRPSNDVAAILLRIEGKLDTLVAARTGDPVPASPPATAPASSAAAAPASSPAATVVVGGEEPASVPATVTPATPPEPPVTEGPAPPSPVANGAAAAGRFTELSDREIGRRIEELDRAIDEARGVLVERFKGYDRELARLRPARRRRKKARPPEKGHASAEERDPQGGAVVELKRGDQGRLVRRSKLAIARFLAAKGNQEHAALRRGLRREARRRKEGALATPRWEKGVRAVQHLAGRPVTGVIDGELMRMLERYWPSDSLARRIVRATPAWRAIPGQVSPNFNLSEFACKDGTPYVAGLVREQKLTKQQARARGRELAQRLERVRKADGDRKLVPTSAFRTRAHNAAQPGAVPNSSHLRGYAVDVPPPAGVSLERHHRNMRAAFERGVGYYPMGRGHFVHGDFDPAFPRRDW